MVLDVADTGVPLARTVADPNKLSLRKQLRNAGFRMRGGMVWPISDLSGPNVKRRKSADIAVALRECSAFRSVVQAGGHCGVWPLALADRFSTVYTFEPDADNFTALTVNTAGKSNIVRFQAALGNVHRTVGLTTLAGRTGRTFVSGEGNIPTLTIDDLGLLDCDLIILDVEGGEMNAFRGARKTIERCRPVLMFEDKGHSRRFGFAKGATPEWLEAHHGYRIATRMENDVVMVSLAV